MIWGLECSKASSTNWGKFLQSRSRLSRRQNEAHHLKGSQDDTREWDVAEQRWIQGRGWGGCNPAFENFFWLFCLRIKLFLRSYFTFTIRLLVKLWKDNVHFAKVVSGSGITSDMNRWHSLKSRREGLRPTECLSIVEVCTTFDGK